MWASEGEESGASGPSRPDADDLPVGRPLVRPRSRPQARHPVDPPGAPAAVTPTPTPIPTRTPTPCPAPAVPPPDVVADPVTGRTVEPAPNPVVAPPTGVPAVGLVVGAATPLGIAFTDALRARGARVCLLDGDAEAVRSTVGDDPDVMVLRCDLSRSDDVLDAMGFLRRAGVRVDVLVQAPDGPVGVGGGEPADGGRAVPSPREMDDRYRREVSGPLWLLAEAAALLRPGATVVVADRPSVGDGDPVGAARDRAVQVVRDAMGDRAGVLRVVIADGTASGDRAAAALVLDLVSLDRLRVTAVEVRPVGPVESGGSLPA
ncbi:MAG: hypothetical protein ACOYOP_13245 [Microthrixaceae bacterium]